MNVILNNWKGVMLTSMTTNSNNSVIFLTKHTRNKNFLIHPMEHRRQLLLSTSQNMQKTTHLVIHLTEHTENNSSCDPPHKTCRRQHILWSTSQNMQKITLWYKHVEYRHVSYRHVYYGQVWLYINLPWYIYFVSCHQFSNNIIYVSVCFLGSNRSNSRKCL